MSHIVHPDIAEAGLADGCPRCEEIARDPLAHLDEPSLSSLWARMVGFEYMDDPACRPRSDAEGAASRVLYEAARAMRKAGISRFGLRRLFDGATLVALDGEEREAILTVCDDDNSVAESIARALAP